MASTLNKRHQARNERALQELIRTVPGNDRCAECQARNPGWASWSLGIFLCMRCAALHRKLGTHISKVKSLSMDSWSNDQVENMKNIGNTNSNQRFNPKNTKPPIPLDVDEIDSAMERFIRQKYEQKVYIAGAPSAATSPAAPVHTGGTGSSDDHPPPPPPKPGRRFGFGLRSSSSALHMSHSQDANEGLRKGMGLPPIHVDKSSKVIGASIGVTESDKGLEWKLLQLQEMGFSDTQKNANILKGMNGDLERTIESLVRQGDGRGSSSVRTPVSSHVPTRQHSPNQPFSAGARVVSVQSTPSQSSQLSPPNSARSNNPFDVPNPVSAPQKSFENAFSDMSISQQSSQQAQTLFPNATGGHQVNQIQTIQGFQQPMTPPVPQATQQFPISNSTYPQQQQQQQQQQQTHNPFVMLAQPTLSSPISTNPYFAQSQSTPSPNPFMNQQSIDSVTMSPSQGQFALQQQQSHLPPQQQTPQSWIQSPQSAQQQQFLQSPTQFTNPQQFAPTIQPLLYAQPSPYGPLSPLNLHSPYQPQMQPLSTQPTGRVDKSSILALYNYPQLAPAPATPGSQISNQISSLPSPQPQAAQLPPGVTGGPHRSATMPVSMSGSKNPFLSVGGLQSPSTGPAGPWHASRESSDSGRHSPDAFASLSARFVR